VLKMSYVTLEFRDMNIFHGFVKQFKGTSYWSFSRRPWHNVSRHTWRSYQT
jgi:hypothetical protein